MAQRKRAVSWNGTDQDDVESAVKALLLALGYDPTSDDDVRDTPARVARAWGELLSGMNEKAEDILDAKFDAHGYDEVVILKDIPFYSVCQHHMIQFGGTAHVAYLPAARRQCKVVGLSKLARLVEMHAKRLQLQERMTMDIARDLERVLKPRGVGVVVKATHLCMAARGVKKPGATMTTSVMLGTFRKNASARAELLELMR